VISNAASSFSSAVGFEFAHEPARAKSVSGVKIQAFCEDQHTAAVVDKASQDRCLAKTDVTVRMGGVQAALAFYKKASTPSLIIIESMLEPVAMLADLDRLAEVCDTETKVIVIGHDDDVLLFRELLRRGVSDYVVAPVQVMQILESISAVCIDPETRSKGRVIAFIGGKGGSGSSTVCHNTAFAIASAFKSDVVIADFDLPFGTASLDFNMEPLQGIADALASPERLDQVLLNRLLSPCSDHLALFAAPGALDRTFDLQPASCDTVLLAMRDNLSWVAADVPHLWTAWAKEVVLGADHVVITAAPDLANLRNTKNLIHQLKASGKDRALLLVLNQVGMPKRPEVSVKDFGRAVELEPSIVIDFDAQLFGTAAINAQMIEETSDRSKAADAFRSLANLLTGRSTHRSERRSTLAPVLARFRLTRKRA